MCNHVYLSIHIFPIEKNKQESLASGHAFATAKNKAFVDQAARHEYGRDVGPAGQIPQMEWDRTSEPRSHLFKTPHSVLLVSLQGFP